MKCTNKDIGQLITLYEFGQLSEEEKKLFEMHLLECDHCFHSLHNLSPVVERMLENPELFVSAIQEPERASTFEVVKNWLEKTLAGGRDVLERLPLWGKVALPAGVAVAILLIILQPSRQLSDLARIEPIPYRALQIRGSIEGSERLFEEGMQFYVEQKYDQAAAKLALAVEKQPDNVSFQFYLGLSYLLAEKSGEAIEHLEKVIELGGNSLLEKAHWYLGNAYLLKGDGEKAMQAFEKVVEMQRDYEWEAREMMGKIEKLAGK